MLAFKGQYNETHLLDPGTRRRIGIHQQCYHGPRVEGRRGGRERAQEHDPERVSGKSGFQTRYRFPQGVRPAHGLEYRGPDSQHFSHAGWGREPLYHLVLRDHRPPGRRARLAGGYYYKGQARFRFHIPRSGRVYFSHLTFEGVRLCVADERMLKKGKDPYSPLSAAAQAVLTELRRSVEDHRK